MRKRRNYTHFLPPFLPPNTNFLLFQTTQKRQCNQGGVSWLWRNNVVICRHSLQEGPQSVQQYWGRMCTNHDVIWGWLSVWSVYVSGELNYLVSLRTRAFSNPGNTSFSETHWVIITCTLENRTQTHVPSPTSKMHVSEGLIRSLFQGPHCTIFLDCVTKLPDSWNVFEEILS